MNTEKTSDAQVLGCNKSINDLLPAPLPQSFINVGFVVPHTLIHFAYPAINIVAFELPSGRFCFNTDAQVLDNIVVALKANYGKMLRFNACSDRDGNIKPVSEWPSHARVDIFERIDRKLYLKALMKRDGTIKYLP